MLAHMSRATGSARPRGCVTICVISRRVTGVTLPRRSVLSRWSLGSAGTDVLARAARSSGWAATTRPNLNSPSSRSSRLSSAWAVSTSASIASCSIASTMSPEVAQRDSTAATTSASVRPVTLPCSNAEATAAFSAAGLPGSDRARRSPCSVSSRPTTANSSSPSRVGPRGLVLVFAFSRSPHNHRLRGRTTRFSARTGWVTAPVPVRASLAGHLELVEEPVHHPALPRLVGERLAHDPAGQLGRQVPDLGAQRGQRLLPLGLDLGLGRLGDPACLGLGLLAHLGDDLRTLLPGLLTHPGGLVPGLGELLAVLVEQVRSLALRLRGAAQPALDLLGPLGQRLGDARHQQLGQQAEHQEEEDRADNELGPRREEPGRRRR